MPVWNNKESLERSINTLKENWAMTRIYAPTSGTVDNVILNQGEAISPGIPLCIIINLTKLKIKGEVTEAYASKVNKGDQVHIYFPDSDKEINTKVSYVSKSINTVNRTFTVECDPPIGKGPMLKNLASSRFAPKTWPNVTACSLPHCHSLSSPPSSSFNEASASFTLFRISSSRVSRAGVLRSSNHSEVGFLSKFDNADNGVLANVS